MNLIVLTAADCCDPDQGLYRLSDHRAVHILDILGCKVGDVVRVGLLNGPQGGGVIERVEGGKVVMQCHWDDRRADAGVVIDLICALPRPQTLKKVLASAATMRVRRIHLVRANRTQKMYFSATLMQEKNFMPYLLAGLSQGRHTRVPEVHIHKLFRPFFEDTLARLESDEKVASMKLLAEMEAGNYLSSFDLAGCKRVLLAIGPEGGWVPFELDLLAGLGFEPFRMGPWTLRVEDAVVASIAQIELATRA